MRFIIVALALMAMFSTASAASWKPNRHSCTSKLDGASCGFSKICKNKVCTIDIPWLKTCETGTWSSSGFRPCVAHNPCSGALTEVPGTSKTDATCKPINIEDITDVLYVVKDRNTNGCDIYLNPTHCETFANEKYLGTETASDFPKGCYKRFDAVYFNTHSTGGPEAKSRPVCAEETPCTTDDKESCEFPFLYSGVTYTACTTVDNGDVPWCATSLKDDGTYSTWGNCNNGCLELTDTNKAKH